MKMRHSLDLISWERSGNTTAANRSTAISVRFRIDTTKETSPKKGTSLQKAWPSWPPTRSEPLVYKTDRFTGIQNIEYSKSDEATILDKTVEKIACLGGIFSKLRSRPILPYPLPLEAVLLGLQKKAGSLSICRKQLWTGGGVLLYAKPFIWK